MKRAQLIELLSMDELPVSVRLEKMTIHQLRDTAKERGLRGFWGLSRGVLLELLFPNNNIDETAPHKNKQDEGNANKHHTPEEHESEDVGVEDMENA